MSRRIRGSSHHPSTGPSPTGVVPNARSIPRHPNTIRHRRRTDNAYSGPNQRRALHPPQRWSARRDRQLPRLGTPDGRSRALDGQRTHSTTFPPLQGRGTEGFPYNCYTAGVIGSAATSQTLSGFVVDRLAKLLNKHT